MKAPTTIMMASLLLPRVAIAEGDDVSALQSRLKEQQALTRRQGELLKVQQQQIEQQARVLANLSSRLDQMERRGTAYGSPSSTQPEAAPVDASPKLEPKVTRDPVGDMNAEAVRAGLFPGSFRIPGPGNVSLAVGGFVKAVAIYDSKAEAMGADFLPATLGTKRPDEDGATSFDATLTRLFLDGRAPAPNGQIRGYVEYDLNATNDGKPAFKLRHAYGTWKNRYGTLTAGFTWSTAMDLKILPEGLTEPTLSGVIFMRQAILRWSQPLGNEFTLYAAVEDPGSSDILDTPVGGDHTALPDGFLGLEYGDPSGLWHLRLNGLVRDLKSDLPAGGTGTAAAWGTILTGHVNVGKKDKLRFSHLCGEGLGRYLLGGDSSAGAIDPTGTAIYLRANWGLILAYEHHWADTLRSTVMGGYAYSRPLRWEPGGTLENSVYFAANLMWRPLRSLTFGVEYAYGRRENKDSSYMDNQRIAVAMQVY